MLRFIWLIVFSAFIELAHSQVPNNQISKRFQLELDQLPITSTTAHSSVEWQCINKALTNKCLVYHNDQWFSFRLKREGSYYINLSDQLCKMKQGTQLILIEGNPCEVKTYRIIKCLSKLPQNDTFIQVDSLKADVTYLVNIDGFLGDACEFTIQLSSHPSGFPLPELTNEKITTEVEVKKRIAKVTWYIEEDRASSLKEFAVLRTSTHDNKGKEINRQPIRKNTYGSHELRYHLIDTLSNEGMYTYKIFGIQREHDVPVLLSTEYARYTPEPEIIKKEIQRELILTLNYEEGFPFKVLIVDPLSSEQLYKYQNKFESAHHSFKLDLGEYIDKGKKEFMIIISDFSAQGSRELFYKLDANGKLVKQ